MKQDLLYSLGAFSTVCQIERNDADTGFGRVSRKVPIQERELAYPPKLRPLLPLPRRSWTLMNSWKSPWMYRAMLPMLSPAGS